jgi:large subunit ribosomal protein L6
MSRIGKNPVAIPEKVEVAITGETIKVKGPKGELTFKCAPSIKLEKVEKKVVVKPVDVAAKDAGALWGMTRTLVNNMMVGVSEGFVKKLEFNGVGYKAAVAGETLTLNLGYSHPIDFKLPKGIQAKVVKNEIEIIGVDKELVGFVAAKIRSFREPEPYKGKGIKYSDETILRKAGKTGGKK